MLKKSDYIARNTKSVNKSCSTDVLHRSYLGMMDLEHEFGEHAWISLGPGLSFPVPCVALGFLSKRL